MKPYESQARWPFIGLHPSAPRSEEPSPQHEVELTFQRYPPLSGRTAPLEDTGEEDSDADTGM